MKRICLVITIFMLAALSCRFGSPAPEQIAATMVAQTVSAASPTPLPSETPQPTATTKPTSTPTITPTPGPVTFTDNFSKEDLKNWSRCDECTWTNGEMVYGPYSVNGDLLAQAHITVCIPCGSASYYHLEVDASFAKGYTDRGFGLLVGMGDRYITIMEITPLQIAILAREDLNSQAWKLLNASSEKVYTTLVHPGKQENHIEVDVLPAEGGSADITVKLNGKVYFVASDQPAEESQVGLYLEWHSVGASFDNFEYKEIVP